MRNFYQPDKNNYRKRLSTSLNQNNGCFGNEIRNTEVMLHFGSPAIQKNPLDNDIQNNSQTQPRNIRSNADHNKPDAVPFEKPCNFPPLK